ncbi:hypothetical protein BGZ83_010567 [Gryganskiella cystojenkinii]|nr:hypothetical protein BGZ83_010567 [Gryganskiella cystojenkinii]
MHSVARTTAKAGSPLTRALSGRVQVLSQHAHTQSSTALLLRPTRAILLQQQSAIAIQTASLSTLTRSLRSNTLNPSSLSTTRLQWNKKLHTSTPAPASNVTTAKTLITVKELEQILSKGDYAAFQQACAAIQSTPAGASKEVYHFLLKTLADSPKAFAPVAAEGLATSISSPLDPLNSAIGILTEMSREANTGNTAMQPDRETLLLLLKVAGFNCHSTLAGQKDLWVLVDAIRHGRLPAVVSLDQWELPDLNIALDQELWKAMFESVSKRGADSGYRTELDTISFLMANQLTKSSDVQIDDKLWTYVVQAFGNAGAAASLSEIYPRLPSAGLENLEYSSALASALANCGWTRRAQDIVRTLAAGTTPLPSITPFLSLTHQQSKMGDYEAVLENIRLWQENGQSTSDSDAIAGLLAMNRSMLTANAVALDRLKRGISKTMKDRRFDVLPENVLPGTVSPPQLSREQFKEAIYIWDKSRDAMAAIPASDLTSEDYDTMIKISTGLNLLLPTKWSIEEFTIETIQAMQDQGLKTLRSTYYTLMEAAARTREFGIGRSNEFAAGYVMHVYQSMIAEEGESYKAKSAQDFLPLIESCFGLYSTSPFTATQWMHSNQLYPVSKDALRKVESLMRKTLTAGSDEQGQAIQNYHDSLTLSNIFAGLAHGDESEEVWRRWDELVFQGVERDATLYQSLIGASQVQENLARGVLRRIRYEMAKEQPPIKVNAEIFSGLLNCCVRTKDPAAARSLIQQYSVSGEIQKKAEWFVPMVRTCLSIPGMEQEGLHLLDEMRTSGMMAQVAHQASFYEFLMDYFVLRRGDFAAGREIFKTFVESEEKLIRETVTRREEESKQASLVHPMLAADTDPQDIKAMSDKELRAHLNRFQKVKAKDGHLVERVELSQRTASMLNLWILADLRERSELIEMEKQSGFGGGAKDRLEDAKKVMRYLVGKNKMGDDAMIPVGSTGFLEGASGRLISVNKYVLGEYIDTCIREGSAEMLDEAEWGLSSVMPRVIGFRRMPAEAQRLRQSLDSARSRQPQQPPQQDHQHSQQHSSPHEKLEQ